MAIDLNNDSTVDEAMQALDAAEAGEKALPKEQFEQTEAGELQQSATDNGGTAEEKSQAPLTDDTRATADKDKQPDAAFDKSKETQTEEKFKPDANGNQPSEFSKNAQRLEKKWTAVTARDAQLNQMESSLKQQAAALEQRAAKLQAQEAKSKSRFTPEQYETAATDKVRSAEQLALQADGMDRRAEQLEQAGKFGEAENLKKQAQDLREQASGEKYSAKQMRDMAEHYRKNPEPTEQQHKATLAQHKQHYTMEAAKQWPDVAVAGSEFQKTLTGHLQAAAKSGLDPEENPVMIYHAARLTAAELTAARVPKLEKDLGAAQARVKELEKFTTPGGGHGAVQKVSQKKSAQTDSEEEAELRALALSIS